MISVALRAGPHVIVSKQYAAADTNGRSVSSGRSATGSRGGDSLANKVVPRAGIPPATGTADLYALSRALHAYVSLYLPDTWFIRVALLGLLLLAVLAWLVSRSRLTRLREAGEYVIGETDRRVGLWLQLHPEEATEPHSLEREGLLGTRDLV